MDERREQSAGKALKRRGILAAAGAAVAGLMARHAAEPAQAFGGFVQTNFTASGAGNPTIGFDASAGTFDTGVWGSGQSAGVQAYGDIGVIANGGLYGVKSYGTGYGVYGYGNLSGTYGVYGDAVAYGVYGNAGSSGVGATGKGGAAGVVGQSTALGHSGVVGFTGPATPASPGIYGGVVGVSDQLSLPAVHGYHNSGTGVKGLSTLGFGVAGATGDAGNINAGVLGTGTAGPGVQGQSSTGHGLIGYTTATDGHAALIGYAQTAGGVGLIGRAPGNVGPWAGVFYGDVHINGTMAAPVVGAAVAHPDGTSRLLPSVVAPEGWVEDFGAGTLANGAAEVKLDPDFAALIQTDGYHVFAMPEGPLHLHVSQKGAAGFTVVAKAWESAPGVKAATQAPSGTFAYRVVAKRKDSAGTRLAKVAPPPAPKPFTPAAVPETPAAKPPATKP